MRPAVPPVAERAYELLAPLAVHDSDETRWVLLLLVVLLVGAEQDLWELTEDPGLATTLSPAGQPPAEWLTFIGSINGARLTEPMTYEQRLREIRRPSGWGRGLPATMLANAAPYLQTGATPRLLRRWHPFTRGDQPYDITLLVRTADVLPGQLPALRAAFSASMVFDDDGWVLPGTLWADESSRHSTWAVSASNHPTWAHAAGGH